MPQITMKHLGGPRAGVTVRKELRSVPRHIGCRDECERQGIKLGSYTITNPGCKGTPEDPAIYRWK